MEVKRIEYWVSHVRFKDTHIQQVKAFLHTIEGLQHPILFTREAIIKSINEQGDQWYSCVLKEQRGNRKIWAKGAQIHTLKLKDTIYLRTDGNTKESDNLGELPFIE